MGDATTSRNEHDGIELFGSGRRAVQAFHRDGERARGRLGSSRLFRNDGGELFGDTRVDAEDKLELLREGGRGRGNVGDGEGVALTVEVRSAEEVGSPERDVPVLDLVSIDPPRPSLLTHACCPASHWPEGKGTESLIAPWQTDASAWRRGR